MARYLIIGNGFDIAHDIPTLYKDFLFICAKVNKFPFEDNYKTDKREKMEKIYDLFKQKYNSALSEIKQNLWILFFLSYYKDIDGNWIDFEKEIKEACLYCVKTKADKVSYQDKYYSFIDKSNKHNWDISRMKNDLENLIDIFNKYLMVLEYDCINVFYPEIVNFLPTGIISFNYTNTYAHVYDNTIRIDYIHGKIGENNNSMVLGFDTMGDDATDIEFGEFIKYFQMVEKDIKLNLYIELQKNKKEKLENSYKLVDITSMDDINRAMFFGHSLDKTDGDIIKTIIESVDDVCIVYFDKRHKNQMIKNLIDIFGRNEFVNLTMSEKKKIYFVQQSEKKVDESLSAGAIKKLMKDIQYLSFKQENSEKMLSEIMMNPYLDISGNALRVLQNRLSFGSSIENKEKKERLRKILLKKRN